MLLVGASQGTGKLGILFLFMQTEQFDGIDFLNDFKIGWSKL